MHDKTFEVKLGISPIGWSNDDLPSLGGETSLGAMLAEGREIGYQGFELGRQFPREPAALRGLMSEQNLALVSGWYSGRLAERSLDAEIAALASHLERLTACGCQVLVYGEIADSIQGQQTVPLYKRPRFGDEAAMKRYGERLTAFGEYLRRQGIRLAYHHHMGAYVQAPEDIDELMACTGDEVGLLFDSGHVYFGGGDPLAILARHIKRVCHVHCKDVRPAIIRHAHNRQWSFLDAVLNGAFTVPGDGGIDFSAIIGILRESGYQGWMVVEAEQDPAVAPSYAYASKGYRVLRALLDEVSFKEVA
ncbi:ap family 2 [Lasius niger]|uniref:Ap family 2 n=1 Tax=Lasius niger TaxID=67767 RepID=A0A0J7JZ20_LASNI|nr:ap family 2 [Lasius niger]